MAISNILKSEIERRIREIENFTRSYRLDELDTEEAQSVIEDLEALSTALEIHCCNINILQRELSCDFGNYFTAKPNAKKLEDITGMQSIELEAEGRIYDVCQYKSVTELEDEL